MTMGIGTNLPRQMIIKRRFRWTFQVSGGGGTGGPSGIGGITIRPIYCKLAARPSLSFEELELNFLNERAWLSGKPTWEPLNVTFIDCQMAGNGQGAADALSRWAHLVYQYGKPSESGAMSTPGEQYKADSATLIMYDGIGDTLETWNLYGVWPQQVNWGDLDYTNNDTADIEVVFRFDNAEQLLNLNVAGGAGQFGSNDLAGTATATQN